MIKGVKMKLFSYYLVKKRYDEMNKRNTSAVERTDGPIRVNSFGTVDIEKKFLTVHKRVDYYLMYLLEGEIVLTLDGVEQKFSAGDFAIFPPYYPIRYEKTNDDRLLYYLAHFSGTDVERFLNGIGFDKLPICVAKTQYSFSDNPTLLGAPEDFTVTVRDVKVSAGAGFIVVLTGAIMTMPGLPKSPSALRIDVDDVTGKITGLF